ncbi:MAG: RsmD family RNA methyltransferase [Bacteroidetes bacterium]|nr:RsmD family RNA methyltransferase [Bacteroidota bacterium]
MRAIDCGIKLNYYSIEPISLHNSFLLSEEELLFFRKHLHDDISKLSLQLKLTQREKEILWRISRRQKIEKKLPSFYNHIEIYYPESISLEQCSSEATALFKSSLFSGYCVLDLSAGMGVDGLFFSRHFQRTLLVEPNRSLADITAHNLKLLAPDATVFIEKGKTAAAFLESFSTRVDLIYVDPSRRDDTGKKVFKLQDCEPNVIDLMPQFLNLTNDVLIKTSPLLDITSVCESVRFVKNVYILSVNNECKELLFHIEKGHLSDYQIHAVDLSRNLHFSFFAEEEKSYRAQECAPLQYLYEPDASLLKAGAFNMIQKNYPLYKIHQHSHLYTSSEWIPNFQGRVFRIDGIVKPEINKIHEAISGRQANLTIRNFPGSVAQLRKKWQLKEGGSRYLFATTLQNEEKAVIICSKCPMR